MATLISELSDDVLSLAVDLWMFPTIKKTQGTMNFLQLVCHVIFNVIILDTTIPWASL